MSDERPSARPDAASQAGAPPARSAQLRELFEAALDISASQRREFLLARCPDESIRREVESLLEHDARASDNFLVPDETPSRLGEDSHDQRSPHAHALPGAEGVDRFIGCRFASYTIKSLIAEGGMGAVYLAEQDRPRRDVALKIMTMGFWSRSARRRFEFETEILGRLHHPNVAQVYEMGVAPLVPPNGGNTDGAANDSRVELPPVPFFAMEYIPQARPITVYCDEERLGLHDRLRLFRVVCDAVHYGHQNGVIHRDLKPDNVLIDAHGHVKVIDFGVARSTDCDVAATMHTEAGQLIGTLAYMSPEQCAADPAAIDTRSDVYSLGAVLFELLTGGLPYDVSHLSVPSATRVICEQPPARPSDVAGRIAANRRAVAPPPPPVMNVAQPPSAVMDVAQPPSAVMNVAQPPPAVFPRSTGFQPVKSPPPIRQDHSTDAEALAARTDSRRFGILASRLRGDLDTIILKCLEKDRDKRYHSVAALADDVERFLRREPIAAHPPTRWSRAVRWALRHPLLVTATTCVLFAIATLTATMLSVWHVRSRPDHIVRFQDGKPIPKGELSRSADDARLMSSFGNELARWGGAAGSIAFAEFIALPARFGGGHVAAIGYAGAERSSFAKSVCVFDVHGDLRTASRLVRIQRGEVLPKLVENRQIDADHFAPCAAIVADVFPGQDYPGDELVVMFSSSFSPRIIRIYDLRLSLLFETWHDGSAASCEWLSESGVLIFSGDDHQRGWDDKGNATTAAPAPLAVFAIKPIPNSINRLGYLNSDENLASLATGRGPPWLKWYKWVYAGNDEPLRIGEYALTLGKATRGDPRRVVNLGVLLHMISGTTSLHWEIDEYGNELPGARTPSESYMRAKAAGERLPDPSSFQLRVVPPDGNPRTRTSSQPAGAAASTPPDSTVTLPTEPQREGELPVEP